MALVKLALLGVVYVFNRLTEHYGAKTVWWSIAAVILIAFGDILVPKMAYVLHLAFETVAYGLEHLLQVNFDLTPRQAEMIVAWVAMIALTGIIIRMAYKAYITMLIAIGHLKVKLTYVKESMEADKMRSALVVSALAFSTIGTTFLLFT